MNDQIRPAEAETEADLSDTDESNQYIASSGSGSSDGTVSDINYDNGPELNYQTLLRLQANEPTVTSVHAHWKEGAFINRVVWDEKERVISNNTRLKTLTLEIEDTSYLPGGYQAERENFKAFCKGLMKNRFIEQLSIIGVYQDTDWMEILSPIIEHNSRLSSFAMKRCRMSAVASHVLASALSMRANKSSFRRIGIVNCMVDRKFSLELAVSLNQYRSLVHLDLGGNRVGFDGCVELAKMLRNFDSQLKVLHLECSNIGDKSIEVLTSALLENRRLKKLSLSQNNEITSRSWRTLSAILNNPISALEALHLAETSLDDDGLAWVGRAMSSNTTLKVLDLYCNERVTFDGWRPFFNMLQDNLSCALEEINLGENNMDDDVAISVASALASVNAFKFLRLNDTETIWSPGWQAISNLFQSHNSSLVELDLNMNNIDDTGAVAMANALTNSPTLKILDISSNSLIRTVGWRALSLCFQNSRLEEINLSENRIDDEDAALLANSLAIMPTLKGLNLCGLHYVTVDGWRLFLAALGNVNTSLEELKAPINSIDDEGVVAFANALANNRSLKTMDLDANDLLSDVAWQAFSQLVCHNSSIMATFLSNHTLSQLRERNGADLPMDLQHSLSFNKGVNKREVARHKIIWAHFQGEHKDLQAFLDMKLQVMPQGLAWIGRDYIGHSLLYQLVRTMPLLLIELG
jgi:Ran GTPase-activating protein (RanGAP) involved in mRNA processing and transport